jgi:hypothetical protein
MVVLSITPTRIYNSSSNENKRPKHIRKRRYGNAKSSNESDNVELSQLRTQVEKYKRGQAKLKRLAEWNLRSTKSSLMDVQETLDLLEDLYGDEAFENYNGKDLNVGKGVDKN